MRVRGALALLLVLAPGCGYSTGLALRERYPNVGVEIFGNESFERDLERAVHDELTRSMRDLTDVELRVPSRADFVVRGVVKTYHRRGGIRSTDNKLLETGVTIGLEASLFQRGLERPLGPPAKAEGQIGFTLDEPEAERIARDRLLRHLADELVLELFSPSGVR